MIAHGQERQRRRKISLACEPCRERKSRCDGGKPICSTCHRRSLGLERCVYKLDNARTASTDEYIKVLHSRIRRLERACIDADVAIPSLDSEQLPDVNSNPEKPRENGQQSHDGPEGACENPRQPPRSTWAKPATPFSDPNGTPVSMDYRRASTALNSPKSLCQTPNGPPHSEVEMSDPSSSSVSAMGTMITEDDVSSSEDFYGSSSTATFLKEAFDSMKDKDSSAPRLPQGSDYTVQISRDVGRDWRRDSSYYVPSHKFSLPPRELADHLMDCFRRKVYYMYPFFHLPSFENAYRSLWQPASEPREPSIMGLGLGCYPEADANTISFHCALNAIFSLSCHFSDLGPADRLAASHTFFMRTKLFVGLDLLESNNLSVVQTLLILALALQSTPFPSRCWNATGVACRVAQGLGLHTEHRQDTRRDLEKEIRRRTWYGCVTMDMLVSMTYGRPTMTTHISLLPLPCGIEEETRPTTPRKTPDTQDILPKFRFYIESIGLCKILEEILSKVYQPWMNREAGGLSPPSQGTKSVLNLETIIGLHEKLSNFEASLPDNLSWQGEELADGLSEGDRALFSAQRALLHARFIYLRIMLLRPVLTQLSANERAEPADSAPMFKPLTDPILAGATRHCSRLCVEAAIELLQLVHGSYRVQTIGAWWWDVLYASTAGTVLIIAKTCPSLRSSLGQSQMAQSWDECQEVLKRVASFNTCGQQSLKLLQTIEKKVSSKSLYNLDSPPTTSRTEARNIYDAPPLQSDCFGSNANLSLAASQEFECLRSLDVMDSFFNWEKTSFENMGSAAFF